VVLPNICPSGVDQLYTEVDTGLVTWISAIPIVPQKIGTSDCICARGARKKSKGPTKSFNSAVKLVEERVLTRTLRKGIPQLLPPPNKVTGSSPSFVRLTENSINWPLV